MPLERQDETRRHTLRMTWASPSSIPKAAAGSILASIQVTTRYFLAGGRARSPFVKEELYRSEEASTFCWIAVMV
jgi:hypothetical protein